MTKDRGISPSISEAMIDRHFGRDPETGSAVADATLSRIRSAMETARLAAEKAERVAAAIMKNEMETLPARHRRVKAESWRAVEGALSQMDSVLAAARSELAALAARTAAPPRPTDAMGTILAGEIRSRLAGMRPDDRRKALSAALRDADDVVLGAVLNAPPMLSGMSGAEEVEVLRSRWRVERHGAEVERAERLSRAIADLDRGGQLVIRFAGSLSSPAVLAQAEAGERAVAAALAS